MVPVAFLPVEPDARRDDDFLRVFVEPGRPPGESAVGDDVVAAVSHQFQIEVAGAAVIDIHMDMGQGGPQVLPGPFYVVREDEVTQGFLRSACRPQPSFHFSHTPVSPRGKSNAEVMRFVQAFMLELWRHIGPETDVPAGDIGVGGREVGFMFGMYKKLAHEFTGTFTGKGREFGGSLIRPEATGYGNIYFLMEMLKTKGTDLKGKTCLISGSGNVAQYTAEKVLELGGKVLTMSDSDGYVYDPDGIDREKLDYIMELKNLYRGRIREYAEQYPGVKYVEGARPWGEKADIALPSATQNEINGDDAKKLIANGVMAVSEGANMPSTPEAIRVFQDAKILYAPGKAANAGGVSVSGLEMTQNSIKLSWSAEEVDEKLKSIMKNIHEACVQYGTEADGYVNYVKGANVAGFMKVAKAMMAQGIL